MSENKATLPSLRNQDGNTIKAETAKMNKLFTHTSTDNITQLNALIYVGAKLICYKFP